MNSLDKFFEKIMETISEVPEGFEIDKIVIPPIRLKNIPLEFGDVENPEVKLTKVSKGEIKDKKKSGLFDFLENEKGSVYNPRKDPKRILEGKSGNEFPR